MSSHRNPSARDTWETPDNVLDRVRQIDAIGLDPATNARNPTGARRFFTPKENGLERRWIGHGLVYCNPPYHEPWYSKLRLEAMAGAEIVALLLANPGPIWFQNLAPLASRVLFWKGRLRFVGAEKHAPFDNAVFYFGRRGNAFERAFGDAGWIVLGGAG